MNEWQVAEWLEKEPRLRAGIVVPYEDAALAAAEIDRLADHPGFVQVLLLVRTDEPLGRRRYWPIYEAAVRNDLPVGIHFGGGRGRPDHGVRLALVLHGGPHGHGRRRSRRRSSAWSVEGVFEQLPGAAGRADRGRLRLAAVADVADGQHWKRLRDEVPHLKRPPSEYVREHVWVTTQPIEEPHRPAPPARRASSNMGGTDRLMFATDYPHWDFDDPRRALRLKLPPEARAQIFGGNAMALYGLS